jgi:hypothetical protein
MYHRFHELQGMSPKKGFFMGATISGCRMAASAEWAFRARNCIDGLPDCMDGLRNWIDGLPDCIGELQNCIGGLPDCMDDLPDWIDGLPDCIHELRNCIDDLPDCIDGVRKVISPGNGRFGRFPGVACGVNGSG